MSGAFDLTPMLNLQQSQQTLMSDRIKRYTRFSSEAEPPKIMEYLKSKLEKMRLVYKMDEKNYQFFVTATSSSGGLISFTIEINQMTSKLFMVDFKKKQGDILEFHKIFRKIQEDSNIAVNTERRNTIA